MDADRKLRWIDDRFGELTALLDPCRLCPRECLAKRTGGEVGECGIADRAVVASVGLHCGEEFPISGFRGSGTIFLTGCNLHCVFCQNWTISQGGEGEVASAEDLADMMLTLQQAGAHNINWVSPTHVVPMLVEGLRKALERGLSIPLVYNSGGYDSLETLRLLDGIIDIYMPDMKYSVASTGKRLSDVDEYPAHNRDAIREMHRQVGSLHLDERGIAQRGLLIRHLVLPDDLAGSEATLDFLEHELSGEVHVNLMDQYHPCYRAGEIAQMGRRPTTREMLAVRRLAAARSSLQIIE